MLSPGICRLLMNHGAHADCLTDWRQRAVHDELAMFSIIRTSIGEVDDCRSSASHLTIYVVIIACKKTNKSFRNYICHIKFSVLCVNKY